MNGILNILKPPGLTSQSVVAFVRKRIGTEKVGHTGTLDPGASGVLPVCIGKATRVTEYLLNDQKTYRAELMFGFGSDTLDKYGEIQRVSTEPIGESEIRRAFSIFKGHIIQEPPMYSAVRYGGKRLYELARQGIVVERKVRDVYIYELDIIEIDGMRVLFDITCSKGTYVRTVCSDIGKFLGSDAIMTFLIRTKSGPFKVEDSITLEEFEDAVNKGNLEDILYPIHTALNDYSRLTIENSIADRVRNGVGFDMGNAAMYEKREKDDKILIFDSHDNFIAVGTLIQTENHIKIEKVFA
jgi:tRNA pseudouridine55 synthase